MTSDALSPDEVELLRSLVLAHGLAGAARELGGVQRLTIASALAGVARPGTNHLLRARLIARRASPSAPPPASRISA